MNFPDMDEFKTKETRLLGFMKKNDYDAIVIGTQANFAWLTCGSDNHVLITSELGEAILVITVNKRICIANTMDARRIAEQEINGLGFELIALKWFETPKDEYAANLVKGLKTLSDIPLPGAECNFKKFYSLHYPMTVQEIKRYRTIGLEAEQVLWGAAGQVRPEMTGSDVETLLMCEFARKKLVVACMIIGVDEEISKWRHPIPWDKPIREYLMLVLAVRRHGIHVPITRLVHFGGVPLDIRRRYDAACTIAANTILSCRPGTKFTDIFNMQKRLYAELGYETEWQNHFIGGITGYIPNDGSLCMDESAVMADRQTFNWYVTITGVNTEDTMIINGDSPELFTANGIWPTKHFKVEKGEIDLPDILVR